MLITRLTSAERCPFTSLNPYPQRLPTQNCRLRRYPLNVDERGWGWTASELRRARLVEWLVQQHMGDGVYLPLGRFYDALPDQSANTYVTALDDVTALESRSLLDLANSFGGIESLGAITTPEGRAFVEGLRNYFSDPVFRASLQRPPEEDPQGAVLRWVQIFGNPLTWDDLPLAALADQAAAAREGHLPSRRRAARQGRRRRRHLLLQPRWPAGQRRPARAGLPARRGRGGRRAAGAVRLGDPQRRRRHQGAWRSARPRWASGRPYAYGLALGGVDGIVHVLRIAAGRSGPDHGRRRLSDAEDLTPDTLRRVG